MTCTCSTQVYLQQVRFLNTHNYKNKQTVTIISEKSIYNNYNLYKAIIFYIELSIEYEVCTNAKCVYFLDIDDLAKGNT